MPQEGVVTCLPIHSPPAPRRSRDKSGLVNEQAGKSVWQMIYIWALSFYLTFEISPRINRGLKFLDLLLNNIYLSRLGAKTYWFWLVQVRVEKYKAILIKYYYLIYATHQCIGVGIYLTSRYIPEKSGQAGINEGGSFFW